MFVCVFPCPLPVCTLMSAYWYVYLAVFWLVYLPVLSNFRLFLLFVLSACHLSVWLSICLLVHRPACRLTGVISFLIGPAIWFSDNLNSPVTVSGTEIFAHLHSVTLGCTTETAHNDARPAQVSRASMAKSISTQWLIEFAEVTRGKARKGIPEIPTCLTRDGVCRVK